MDDELKISILRSIKKGSTESQIIKEAQISKGTFLAILSEFECIKSSLEEMKSLDEIGKDLELPVDYLEKVRHIIETDQPDDGVNEEPPQLQEESDQPQDEAGGPKKVKKKRQFTENIEQKLIKSGEEKTAEVLLKDAGGIAESLAIERQEIGKYVQENVATIASQYGYTSHKLFMEHLLLFWIENQGKVQEMQDRIDQYEELIGELRELIERDIVSVNVQRCIDNVLTAALTGGGRIDIESLEAYKNLLLTDPDMISRLINKQKSNQNQKEAQILEMV